MTRTTAVEPQQGFTLLEILIAISITALLVMAAIQAHLGIMRAQQRATGGIHRDRAAEILLDRLERELTGAFLITKPATIARAAHPYLFLGADVFDEERDADSLRFVTTPYLRERRVCRPGSS